MTPTLTVTEIFHSLQGESTYLGSPCTFVRLTGCDLHCRWCDTEYAFYGGERLTIDQILERVGQWRCKLVEITGGEPLLQEHTSELAKRLMAAGYQVLVETGGHRDIDRLPPGARRIMDLKAPLSGEAEANAWENLARLRPGDELKVVIAGREDYDWTRELFRTGRLPRPGIPVHLTPAYGLQDPAALADWILADELPVRLTPQLHKALWGEVAGR